MQPLEIRGKRRLRLENPIGWSRRQPAQDARHVDFDEGVIAIWPFGIRCRSRIRALLEPFLAVPLGRPPDLDIAQQFEVLVIHRDGPVCADTDVSIAEPVGAAIALERRAHVVRFDISESVTPRRQHVMHEDARQHEEHFDVPPRKRGRVFAGKYVRELRHHVRPAVRPRRIEHRCPALCTIPRKPHLPKQQEMRRRDLERCRAEPVAVRIVAGQCRLGIAPKRSDICRQVGDVDILDVDPKPFADHAPRGGELRVLPARSALARGAVGAAEAEHEFQAIEHRGDPRPSSLW